MHVLASTMVPAQHHSMSWSALLAIAVQGVYHLELQPPSTYSHSPDRLLLGVLWCAVLSDAGSLGLLVLKLGPKYDMGALCPNKNEGWQKAAVGKDWCVWFKPNDAAGADAQ